jgi:hypothetical protein
MVEKQTRKLVRASSDELSLVDEFAKGAPFRKSMILVGDFEFTCKSKLLAYAKYGVFHELQTILLNILDSF